MSDILDRDLRDHWLPITQRLRNCLLNDGFKTLREAGDADRQRLLSCPNLGKKTLAELDRLIAGNAPTLNVGNVEPLRRRRHLNALALRLSGMTYRAIGEQLGVSVARARQIVVVGELIAKAEAAAC